MLTTDEKSELQDEFTARAQGRNRPPEFIQKVIDEKEAGIIDPATESPGVAPNFGQYALPHLLTYQSLHGTYSRVYKASDEAIKHSIENSRFMRNDVGIMECVEARQRATALLDWHIQPEDDNSQSQKDLCTELTKIMSRIRRFTEYRNNLLHAIWYGKYAVQNRYGWQNIGGTMRVMPTPLRENYGWQPINGDKLVFRYDDGQLDPTRPIHQLGVRVGHRKQIGTKINKRWEVEPTGHGLAYFLSEYERRSLVVHKHLIEDGAYEDNWGGEQIHGVGVRSRIYWDWFQKQETLSFLMEYLERSAGGIEIWSYPAGDKGALEAAKSAATDRISNQRNVVFFPKPMGDEGAMYDVQVIEPGMAGIESLKDIVTNYFGHRAKRYILGQTLSTEADATGLGSGVAELHYNSFLMIVKYDAVNLEETITRDLLRPLQEWNFPKSKGIDLQFKIETESPDVEKRLEAYQAAWSMGASLSEADVMDMIGASVPTDDESVLKNPQLDPDAQQGMDAMGGMGGGMPGMDPMGGMPQDGDGDGIAGEGTSQATAVGFSGVDQMKTDAIDSMYNDPETAAPGDVTYVNEGGEYQTREMPDFDTGDRKPEGKVERFQKIDSAGTSLNQIPALFKQIAKAGGWKRGATNLDIGGGKYDKGTGWLGRLGIKNLVYDPFNRDQAQNAAALKAASGGVPTVTLANVLNVIAEKADQIKALQLAKKFLAPGGLLYVDVHEGDGSGQGKATSRGYQQNRKLADYIPLIQSVFPQVEKQGGVIVATAGAQGNAAYSRMAYNLAEVDRYDRQMQFDWGDSDDGEWKTINRTHVYVEGGEITKGPPDLVGRGGESRKEDRPTPRGKNQPGGQFKPAGDSLSDELPAEFGKVDLPILNNAPTGGDPPEASTGNAVRLDPLESYDKVLVQFSGGKDSLAALLDLIDRGVDPKKIELWHQRIDGDGERFMDWPVTEDYVRAIADHLGVKLRMQWREGGFKRELERHKERTQGVWFEDEDGKRKFLPTTKGGETTREKWPAKSCDLGKRWCSATLKIDVAARSITNDPSLKGDKLLFVSGERREEGGRRSKYLESEKHRTHNKSRTNHHYRPVIDWSEKEVWDKIKEHGINPHPAYQLGYNRLSCQHCIFADPDQVASNKELDAAAVERLAEVEDKLGHTISATPKGEGISLRDWAEQGVSFVTDSPDELKKLAMSTEYTAPIHVGEDWEMPKGALKKGQGAPANYARFGYSFADVERYWRFDRMVRDMYRANWQEADHPRDDSGQFAERSGATAKPFEVPATELNRDVHSTLQGAQGWVRPVELFRQYEGKAKLLEFIKEVRQMAEAGEVETKGKGDKFQVRRIETESPLISDTRSRLAGHKVEYNPRQLTLFRKPGQADQYRIKSRQGQQTFDWNEEDHPRDADGKFATSDKPSDKPSDTKNASDTHNDTKSDMKLASDTEIGGIKSSGSELGDEATMAISELSEEAVLSAVQTDGFNEAAVRSVQAHTKTVVGRMNAACRMKIANNLERIKYAPDLNELTRQYNFFNLAERRLGTIGGFYMFDEKWLFLNGAYDEDTAIGKGGAKETAEGIQAHEFAHAIDGPKFVYSNMGEWKAAWDSEIWAHKSQDAPLTRYAATDAQEGFAEFGRLLFSETEYSQAAGRETIRVLFPRCYKFWLDMGLIDEPDS